MSTGIHTERKLVHLGVVQCKSKYWNYQAAEFFNVKDLFLHFRTLPKMETPPDACKNKGWERRKKI